MMEQDGDTIRAVAWSEVFPWLRIIRAFRLALALRALVFGAVGILLTAFGWALIGTFFNTDSHATKWLEEYVVCPWAKVTDAVVSNRLGDSVCGGLSGPQHEPGIFPKSSWRESNPLFTSWKTLTQPAVEGISYTGLSATPPRAIASILLCGLWAVAVWAFFGAAICRTAAVQLAIEEQVGWGAAMRFAGRKWPAYFAAPLLPVGGVLLMAIPVIILGLIMRAGGVGILLGGIAWPLALIAGFIMALLLLGVLFGWPLMWGAISVEGSDSFDALSRSYAYIFQKPLHYLFYAVVAALIGWLGWLLVREFAAGVVWMSYWAAGWGCGEVRVHSILGAGGDLGGVGWFGAGLIRFWAGCVKLLAVGFLFSYFWSASTAIYLLLRRDVDAMEMDEVYLDADEEPADLPTIGADPSGAPVAEGDAADSPEANLPEAPEV
ncbi:MAG: hypothetical protein KKE86_02110 [Planctomycetes bacterium]|nr:hypothetical protein [Planctomycetota bacterium]MBU4398110.1 hypothetical protein [Planctomycetota bacterium]MCG2683491.1 hypothetical protein [Planctomycetales bacterium]